LRPSSTSSKSKNSDWTIEEAALYLGISVSTIGSRLRSGTLRGYKIQTKTGLEWRIFKPLNAKKRYVRPHVLPWSTWLDRLPSLGGLNRRDVRNIAGQTPGTFPLASSHTSYVSSLELFKLRRQLRHQAKLKSLLLKLRRELISKTHGWLLSDDGEPLRQNEPCISIVSEIERITETLSIYDKKPINIDKALARFYNRL
jgi:excisionase family DNA binding protein